MSESVRGAMQREREGRESGLMSTKKGMRREIEMTKKGDEVKRGKKERNEREKIDGQ